MGFAIILFESKKDSQDMLKTTKMGEEDGYGLTQDSMEEQHMLDSAATPQMRSNILLYAQLGQYAPAVKFVESLESDFNRTSKMDRILLPLLMFCNRVELYPLPVPLARCRTT